MLLSKSFGYAIRSILYIAMLREEKSKVQLDEIAEVLNVPRFFLGKVMHRLVKDGIITSVKGHYGGFCLNEKTLHTSLEQLSRVTGDHLQFDTCVLQLKTCSETKPCPFHSRIVRVRDEWQGILRTTSIGDLFKKGHPGFLESIVII